MSASMPPAAVLLGFAAVVCMTGAAALWLAIVGGIVVVTGAAALLMGAAAVIDAAVEVIGAALEALAETGTGLGAASCTWTMPGDVAETGRPIAWTDPEEGDPEAVGPPAAPATAVDAEADADAGAEDEPEAEGAAELLMTGLLDAALAESLGTVLAEADAEVEAEADVETGAEAEAEGVADAEAEACGQLRLVSEAASCAVRKSKRFWSGSGDTALVKKAWSALMRWRPVVARLVQ